MENEEKFEDEINLMDYLNVILKRKWLIFIAFVLAVAGAGVFSYFSPRIYRAEAVLEIGHTGRVERRIVEGKIVERRVIEEPTQISEE